MVKKKISGLLLIFFLAGTVQGISVSVQDSCNSGQDRFLSLNKTDGGHIAEPGFYPNQVCIEELEDTSIRDSCRGDEQLLFTMESKTNSHLSTYSNEYNYDMCTSGFKTSVRDTCRSNQTKLLSLRSENNSHAAAPTYTDSVYNQSLCLGMGTPQNTTVSLTGFSGALYSDGTNIGSGESILPPINYPYITDNEPKGLIGYGQVLRINRPTENKISITQDAGSGEFLLPLTRGGHQEIENEEESITERTFLNSISPTFGFSNQEEPTIRVRYMSKYNLDGLDSDFRRGENDIRFENQGLQGNELLIDVELQ